MSTSYWLPAASVSHMWSATARSEGASYGRPAADETTGWLGVDAHRSALQDSPSSRHRWAPAPARMLSPVSLQGARFTPVMVPLSETSGEPPRVLEDREIPPERQASPANWTRTQRSPQAPRHPSAVPHRLWRPGAARPRRHAPTPRSSDRSPALTQPSVRPASRSPTKRPVNSGARSPPAPSPTTRQPLASSRS